MTQIQPTGEEWRNLEQADACYRPERWDALVAGCRAAIPNRRMRRTRLLLRDRAGRPLIGRTLAVEQIRSDFHWGFCGWGLVENARDGTFDDIGKAEARAHWADLCNAVNIMMYWAERHATAPQTERDLGRPSYDMVERVVDWANAHGLYAKGHPLFWPVPKGIPAWMSRYEAATRRSFLEVRVRSIVGRLKGRMRVYDAVNEMLWEPALRNTAVRHWPHIEDLDAIAGDAADVLGWARDEDPDACYVLNDYGIDHGSHEDVGVPGSDSSRVTRHGQLQRFAALLRRLADRGVPPDAVGTQTPHGDWAFHHGSQQGTYATLGSTGLPVHITEYRMSQKPWTDASVPAAEARDRFAEYIENYLTVAFADPHVEAFWFWGNNEMFHDGQPTSVYRRIHDLIRNRWMTRTTVTTDAEGCAAFDGFTGDYVVRQARGTGFSGAGRFAIVPGTGAQDADVVLAR